MSKSTKKKSAKKPANINRSTSPAETTNQLPEPFEIEITPPPLAYGGAFAAKIFTERVSTTISKMTPGQAFVVYEQHSIAWIRTLLRKEFPQHILSVIPLNGNKKGARIYLRR